MTDGLITPELTPNAGEPSTPTVATPFEYVDVETPIIDDGLPFTPFVIGGPSAS